MILSSLVRYYDVLAARGEVEAPGYGYAKVTHALVLSPAGELLDVMNVMETVPVGKKQKEVAKVMRVPEPVIRSSGVMPNFLCDGTSYMLGWDEKGKPERTKECFEAARDIHLAVLQDVDTPAAKAIVQYFETWKPEQAADHPVFQAHREEIAKSMNLAFMVDMFFAQDDPEIMDAWMRHYGSKESAGNRICLVTGDRAPVAVLHPKIKGVRGAQAVGASLVSFNARAFESYGGDEAQGLNAPVSERAAFAYVMALNNLIASQRHRTMLGETTVVFWSEDGNELASELMAINMGMGRGDAGAEKMLGSIMTKVAKGEPVDESIDINCPFCVLGLAPNAARIAVRFFLRDTFGAFLKRLHEHYERLDIVHGPNERAFLRIPDLMDELANPYQSTAKQLDVLSGSVLRAVLGGFRYPQGMYSTALLRTRAQQDDKDRYLKKVSRGRMAILKAFLLHNSNDESIKEGCTVSLNESCREPAYVLGRLFSVFEKIQQDANPSINATITARYFNSASTTPGVVFPTLRRLSTYHLNKLDKGHRIYLEKQLIELYGMLDPGSMPKQLTLEEQGLFDLGYYHQTQTRYIPNKDKKKEDS